MTIPEEMNKAHKEDFSLNYIIIYGRRKRAMYKRNLGSAMGRSYQTMVTFSGPQSFVNMVPATTGATAF